MKVLAIIPARYHSSRFPGKPLIQIGEKSMIQRVYEQVEKTRSVDRVVVATDDDRIFRHLFGLKYAVEMTDTRHQSGTDRCAEIAKKYLDYEIVLNVQGDEPFIAPEQIDAVVLPLKNQTANISTLAKRIAETSLLTNPNVVKVVRNQLGNALYFSRSAIPFLRGIAMEKWLHHRQHFQHIGLYGFRRETILEITQLPVSNLETLESLEQLRWLENGFTIAVALTEVESFGIDTPEDLNVIKKKFGF